MRRRHLIPAVVAVALLVGGAAVSTGAKASAPAPPRATIQLAANKSALLRLSVPDAATVKSLVRQGYDLAGPVHTAGSSYLVDAVVTGKQLRKLRAEGITPT